MNQQYSFNLGLSKQPETTSGEAYIDLSRLYSAVRLLQEYLDKYTGVLQQDSELWSILNPSETLTSFRLNRLYRKTLVDITVGKLVNFTLSGGELQAQLADSTDATKPAMAYATGNSTAGNFAEFILPNAIHPYYAGLTVGTIYYLSKVTPGSLTSTPPATVGNLVQPIGYAITDTQLYFCPSLSNKVV
jgi:hypothetical protein